MGQGQTARAIVRAAAALEAIENVVLLHILEVALLVVLIHVQRLELHRADGQALAAVDARRVLDGAVFLVGEEQDARGALDVGRLEIRGDQAHHGAAEDDLLRLDDEAAALLDDVAERSAEAALQVVGLIAHGAAGNGEDTLDAGHAFVAGAVDGVSRLGADDVAADAGRQAAGLDLTVRDGLDLHLLSALRVLDVLRHDLHAVLRGVFGQEQIDGVLLVLLDAVVSLVEAGRDARQLDALEQLLGVVLHGQVVAVEVRLALCAVDDEGIDFAKAAADLERGREHGAAVTDDTGLADAVKDGFGILHLLGRQGREIRAGGVLEVIFDHDRGDHIAQGVGSRLDGDHLAGDRRVDGSGDGCRIVSDLLTHLHIIAHRDQRFAGCADMLHHREHDLRRRSNNGHRDIRRLHVVGMNSAMKLKGHLHHLSIF